MEKLKQKVSNSKLIKGITIAIIIMVPLIYSFFFLNAFYDPYGTLKDLKVGIVNYDEGYNGENKGEELQNKIVSKDDMKFEKVDTKDADTLLVNEEYYAMIKIPKDFTESLKSAEGVDKKATTITYSPNKKYNFIASQIIKMAVNTLEKEIRAEVSSTVVGTLADKLNEVPDKMDEISNGAGKIENGADSLTSGLNELSEGINTLDSKYSEFDNGIDKVYSGSKSLTNGIGEVNTGISKLQTGAKELDDGLGKINTALNGTDLSGLSTLTTGIQTLNSGVDAYVDGTESLANGVKTLNETLTTNKSQMQYAIDTNLVDDATKAQYQIQIATINSILNGTGYSSLVSGANTLTTATATGLTSGGDLKAGAAQLNSSTTNIQNLGIKREKKLKEKGFKIIEKVKIALNKLNEGSTSAVEGSKQLSDGINTLKTAVDSGVSDTRKEVKKLSGLDDFAANPVEVEEVDHGDVPTYGIGFAPYFISLSLWVGALVTFIILYFDQEKRFNLLGNHAEKKILRTILYGVIAVAEGLVLGTVLKASIGFDVSNVPLYYLTCILVAVLFFNIVEFLIVTFGDLGKLVAFVLLVFQIVATGGTFPVETLPNWLQHFYSILPMSYTIKLLKESFGGIDTALLNKNLIIVCVLAIVFIGINAFNDTIRKGIEIKNRRNNK